jgi:hypothetical protein
MVSLATKYSADGYFSQAREAADSINDIALKAQALLAISANLPRKITIRRLLLICSTRHVCWFDRLHENEGKIHILTRAARNTVFAANRKAVQARFSGWLENM